MRLLTLFVFITVLLTSSPTFGAVPCISCVPWLDRGRSEPRNTRNTRNGTRRKSVAEDIVDSDTIFREVSRRPTRPDVSAKVEALLKRMTLEEKVGQMTQLTIDIVTTGDDQDVRTDEAKLQKAVVQYLSLIHI